MAKPRVFGYVQLGFLSATLLTAGVLVFQLNSVEQRLTTQASQLRALGESVEKLAAQRVRPGASIDPGASSAAAGEYSDVKVLHPDVPNLLSPRNDPKPPEGVNTEGVLVREWDSGEPKGFNALTDNYADLSYKLLNYTVSSLGERDGWEDPETWWGDLAWRVEVTDDYKELTVYLRRDIQWHPVTGVDTSDPKYEWLRKPHPFTARDVVFTFDLIVNPQVENGASKHSFKELESVQALDDYTVRARWKKKQYGNISNILEAPILPEFLYAYDERGENFPKETLGVRFNQHWYTSKGLVGTGPYVFSHYEPGKDIKLERYDSFHGQLPAIREIRYPIYSDPNQTIVKLKAQEITMAELRSAGSYREEIKKWENVPKEQWPKNNPFLNGQIQCEPVQSFYYAYIGWNANKAKFADKRVRQALTYALNRQGIITDVYEGLGVIATGPYLPGRPYNDPSVEPYPFDLEKAKQLLAEAGWVDANNDGIVEKKIDGAVVPFEFSLLLWGGGAEGKAMANIYKNDLLKIGVKLNAEPAEWSLMQKKMDEKQFDAVIAAWGGGGWEEDPYQLWHSSNADVPKGSNRVGFRNKEVDALIEKLRVTFDAAERTTMLRRIHVILHEEQPYTFFRNHKLVYCFNQHIHGPRYRKIVPQISSLPWWIDAN